MNHLRAVADDSDDNDVYEDPAVATASAGQSRARAEGMAFDELAYSFVKAAGAEIELFRHRVGVVHLDARIRGSNGRQLWLLAHGNVDVDSKATQPGLQRTDTVRKAGGSAMLLARELGSLPVLLVTSHLPRPGTAALGWLRAHRRWLFDVIAINGDLPGFHRLQQAMTAVPAPPPQHPQWLSGESESEQLSLASELGDDYA